MPQDKLKDLLPQLARRGTDSVFNMMNDMNHDLFESSYVIPMINKTKRLTRVLNENSTAVDIVRAYKLNVIVSSFAPSRGFNFRAAGPLRQDAWAFRTTTASLYPKYFESTTTKTPSYMQQDMRIESILREDELKRITGGTRGLLHLNVTSNDELNEDQRSNILDLFEKSGYANWVRDTEACFRTLCGEVPKAHRKRTRDLKAVLRL